MISLITILTIASLAQQGAARITFNFTKISVAQVQLPANSIVLCFDAGTKGKAEVFVQHIANHTIDCNFTLCGNYSFVRYDATMWIGTGGKPINSHYLDHGEFKKGYNDTNNLINPATFANRIFNVYSNDFTQHMRFFVEEGSEVTYDNYLKFIRSGLILP